MKYLLTLDSKMETKLITKTIKELADEFDSNVDQLHREIRRYEQVYKWKTEEIELLKHGIKVEILARAKAEKKADISAITMIIFCAASAGLAVYNYLFG